MIQEIKDNLVTVNDTISLAIKDLILANNLNSSYSGITDVWAIFGPILTAILGGAFVLWYKSNEIQNMKENLDLQKQIFDQTKINQENQLKAELVRLQDLGNQYKLSLRRFDFEKISKILELTDDKNDKLEMVKGFRKILQDLSIDSSVGIGDFEGFEDFSIRAIYNNLEHIKNEINEIRNQFPHIFTGVQDELKRIAQFIENVNYEAGEIRSLIGIDYEDVIERLRSSLIKIQENLNSLLNVMVEEFAQEERLKKELISVKQ